MNKGLFTLLLIYIGIIFQVNSQDITSMTLEECIQIGLENNLELQRTLLNQTNNETNLMEAKMQRYPSLSVNSTYRVNYGQSISSVTGIVTQRDIANWQMNASSNMSLFSGRIITNSIHQARTNLEAGELDTEATRNNISLNIVNLFVNVVFAKEQIGVAKAQAETTSQQLDRTRKLVDAGSLPLADQLDLEAQNATSALDLTNASNNLRIAKLNLSQAMQLPFDDDFDVSVPELEVADFMINSEDANEIFSVAEGIMPEVKAAALGAESAEYGVKIAKGAFYPSLSLGGGLLTNYENIYNQDVSPVLDQFNGNGSLNGQLSLSIPILSQGKNKANLQRARVQQYISEIAQQEVKNQLRQDIETAYTNAIASKQSYESSTIRVTSLEESFRMAQKRFEIGVINAVDFQIAQNNLFSAQADLLQAKYEYIFRVKVLDFYLGNPLTL